jgi:hypothetical protein
MSTEVTWSKDDVVETDDSNSNYPFFSPYCSLPMATSDTTEGKKAVDAPPVSIGWDSHKLVVCLVGTLFRMLLSGKFVSHSLVHLF